MTPFALIDLLAEDESLQVAPDARLAELFRFHLRGKGGTEVVSTGRRTLPASADQEGESE